MTNAPTALPPPAGPTRTGRDDSEQQLAALRRDYTGWHVWRTTDAGTWWATQRGRAWAEPRTLAADDADGLRAALRQAKGGRGQ